MTLGVALLAFSVGIDVFAGGLAYGVADLPRRRWISAAAVFAAVGLALFTVGLLLGEALSEAASTAVSYVAALGLLAIGVQAIWDVVTGEDAEEIESLDDPPALQRPIVLTAVLVSLDKLAIGFSLAVTDLPLGVVLVYVAVVSFLATLLGLALGRRLGSRLGATAHGLAGGAFVLLAVVIIYQALSGDNAY
jgi:putative Mn2+ efflux pump MntP